MAGAKLLEQGRSERGYGVIDMEAPWNYRPWLRSRDVCRGNGQRHIISDLKYPQRQIHLMSNLELEVYYMFRRNEQVQELFEQYPLNIEKTIHICEDLNLSHPRNPDSNELVVMTTDFVAIVGKGNNIKFKAYAVKTSSDLNVQRILEKLKIEQLYWQGLGVSWSIITEQDL